ncbi:pentapeptide repeat-containing protein [Streptomyces sp. NPDC051572]|uniref:pentapeptide repeat-containing protein n=1 Tax=unclassified Streptomyces TaxID=2593676 RepID=UPI003450E3CE
MRSAAACVGVGENGTNRRLLPPTAGPFTAALGAGIALLCTAGTYQLTQADLTQADLTHADLTGAIPTKTKLSLATLTTVSLRRITLTQTGLSGADLMGARFSQKDKAFGGNVPVLCAPDGTALWFSEVEPGSAPNITAARVHVLPALHKATAEGLPTLADKGYIGIRIPVRRLKGQPNTPSTSIPR